MNTNTYASQNQNAGNDDSSAAEPQSKPQSRKAAGAFRTISEVAQELDVQQHVLRFWETKFSQVRPLKRGGGRRYYRPEDVDLLKKIHTLLYTEGYTIKGVQKLLRQHGKNKVLNDSVEKAAVLKTPAVNQGLQSQTNSIAAPQQQDTSKEALKVMLEELKALRDMVKG